MMTLAHPLKHGADNIKKEFNANELYGSCLRWPKFITRSEQIFHVLPSTNMPELLYRHLPGVISSDRRWSKDEVENWSGSRDEEEAKLTITDAHGEEFSTNR